MAWFRYKLIDSNGRPRGGLIELPFESPMSATTYLERQGGTVIFAQPLPWLLAALIGMLQRLRERPVKGPEVAEALTNLSVMIRSGIPAITAIRDAIADSDNPTLARVGEEMVVRVEGGTGIAAAIQAYPRVFPETVGFLIDIGERSGTLDRTSRDAAEHVKRTNQIKEDIKKAVTYPAFMILAVLAALTFWLAMVVPVVRDLFEGMGVELPALTVAIIQVSDWMVAHYVALLTGLAVAIGGLVGAVRTLRPVRRLWHRILLRLPVVGNAVMTSNIAFIAEYLGLMLNAGVDMMSSLRTLRHSVANEVYRERLDTVGNELLRGRPLRDAFETAGVFPRFVQRMVGVGEESGQLTEQLQYIAEEYQRRLNNLVAGLSKVIEPIALAIGGGLFLVLIVGLFLPIFDLVAEVGEGV